MAAVVATEIEPVSGRHEPGRIAAGVARPDLQPPEARWIDEGVVVEDHAYNRSRGADAVGGACSEGEGNGFFGLDLSILGGIHRYGGDGGFRGKDHRLGGGAGRYAGVISSKRGGTAHGVVHRQSGCGRPGSCEGINKIGRAIFCD